jgi:excisionase family DNA binding protein
MGRRLTPSIEDYLDRVACLPEEPLYLSVADVAVLFNLSTQSVRNYIALGDIPALRLSEGGAYRIPASWIVKVTAAARERKAG